MNHDSQKLTNTEKTSQNAPDTKWFSIELRDPATPSFCTFKKDFWGDEAMITDYLQKCENIDVPFTPCSLVRHQSLRIENASWDHINVWDCVYHMRADHITVDQVLLEANHRYFLCIRPVFHNLCYDNPTTGDWISIPDRFWGNPHMIEKIGDDYIASLFTTQECFSSEKEGLEMMGDPTNIRFHRVCDEIFGDG